LEFVDLEITNQTFSKHRYYLALHEMRGMLYYFEKEIIMT